jgi:hypothetical protein
MISHRFLTWACALSAIGLWGCPNTEREYDDFVDRYETIHPPTTSMASSGAGGGCALPDAGTADYLLALLARPATKDKPVLFDAKVTTQKGAAGSEFKMELQALNATDRTTPVGMPLTIGPFPLGADGGFDAKLPPLTVTGDANPLTPGMEIEATVELIGKMCAPADFVCGIVNGNVTKPVKISLNSPQSTFTLTRLMTPGDYPEPPKINCAGDLAAPKK